MADSYVCSGAMMRCTMGTSPAKLTVLPIRTVFLTGQPMANISDHLSMVNLAPFGLCRSMGFPSTASATAANHGTLTPMPCMHNTPYSWMNGKNDYIVKGDPALLKSSTCQCIWGGTISLITDGQSGEGVSWVQQKNGIIYENKDEKKAEKDKEWSWLDKVELIPVIGSIVGIVRSVAKKDGLGIALNIGFLALDVAGVFTMGGTTVAATAGKIAVKAAIKGTAKSATKKIAKKGADKVATNVIRQGKGAKDGVKSGLNNGMKKGRGNTTTNKSGNSPTQMQTRETKDVAVATKEKPNIEKQREELERIYKGDSADRPASHSSANKNTIEHLERSYKNSPSYGGNTKPSVTNTETIPQARTETKIGDEVKSSPTPNYHSTPDFNPIRKETPTSIPKDMPTSIPKETPTMTPLGPVVTETVGAQVNLYEYIPDCQESKRNIYQTEPDSITPNTTEITNPDGPKVETGIDDVFPITPTGPEISTNYPDELKFDSEKIYPEIGDKGNETDGNMEEYSKDTIVDVGGVGIGGGNYYPYYDSGRNKNTPEGESDGGDVVEIGKDKLESQNEKDNVPKVEKVENQEPGEQPQEEGKKEQKNAERQIVQKEKEKLEKHKKELEDLLKDNENGKLAEKLTEDEVEAAKNTIADIDKTLQIYYKSGYRGL